LNQSGLAAKLGVSKGYVSQIMNGNFNFSLILQFPIIFIKKKRL
jgi:transcriptional regulator with XRE-family HTH domain